MSGRRTNARPKRAGEEFTRTHQNDTDSPASKKLRFDVRNPSALAPDAVEEDAMLDADEIGKRGQQAKRNAVNIDGYESDSSNEGFDARAEAKAKGLKIKGKGAPKKSQDEEENDMFADLEETMEGGRDGDEDEEAHAEGKKKRKEVKFLGQDDIEGQVLGSKSGGHISADFSLKGQGMSSGKGKGRATDTDDEDSSSTASDVDDETRADPGDVDEEIGAGGKKEHAPKKDAFNMRNENEEGRFDDQGNFVRKAADPDAMHDSWLEGVSKADMKRAKEAADKRNDELRIKRIEDDKVLTSEILKTLIRLLDRGETVLEALARLGKGNKKEKPRWQKNRRKSSNEMDVDRQKEPEDAKEKRRRETVEAITGAADQLLTRGQTDVYDTERELLTRQYARETGEQWVDEQRSDDDEADGPTGTSDDSREWHYRWADGRDGGQTHGPFDSKMMKAWNEAGYFGEGVEYKEVGQEVWSDIAGFA